ncbi:gas vesicle protein GvpH [Halorubellus salinus]|uniref:gas vesicle protein GvpH n=1 Tax=Halorubellus salinus TaxID=755309 RepID=UPI001D091867|nr:gas vesicle protein GvpH [Halorubellus salinus]
MTERDSYDSDDGLADRLRRLLEALDELDDGGERWSVDGEGSGVNVDVDVEFGTLEDALDRPSGWSRASRRPRRGRPERSERDRPTVDYTVAVRGRADGATVTVDLGGTSAPVPTAAVANGELRLGRDGETVERVPLPFEGGRVADRSENNGVMVVTVDGDGRDDDSGGDGT